MFRFLPGHKFFGNVKLFIFNKTSSQLFWEHASNSVVVICALTFFYAGKRKSVTLTFDIQSLYNAKVGYQKKIVLCSIFVRQTNFNKHYNLVLITSFFKKCKHYTQKKGRAQEHTQNHLKTMTEGKEVMVPQSKSEVTMVDQSCQFDSQIGNI